VSAFVLIVPSFFFCICAVKGAAVHQQVAIIIFDGATIIVENILEGAVNKAQRAKARSDSPLYIIVETRKTS
jgi:hypothetical protein